MGTLPPPAEVVEAARDASESGTRFADSATLDVAVAGAESVDAGDVRCEDDAYVGPGAGTFGRLAIATAAVDDRDARLHYQAPDYTASGPWLVFEPLAHRIATVQVGRGTATVAVDAAGRTAHRRIERAREAIDSVLSDARPRHDHYPVHADEDGVFVRGMTTFELKGVESPDDRIVVTFSVSVTPATNRDAVERALAGGNGDRDVTFEVTRPPVRAAPGTGLRAAAEDAHQTVVGDAAYEWLPEPTVFSAIAGHDKLAIGPGAPGAEEFTAEQYETGLRVATGTIDGRPA
ncbi:MAG: hypothetical protein V5A33_05580 [Halobacteriales archaeon]